MSQFPYKKLLYPSNASFVLTGLYIYRMQANSMTIKEAILKSLEDIRGLAYSPRVYEHIVEKGYYVFTEAKTPAQTVSALMGDFIRNGDKRVKRIRQPDGTYLYYLSKFEDELDLEQVPEPKVSSKTTKNGFDERDLHPLLSTYLNSDGYHAKTIYHERSKGSQDAHQKWIHPDMVAIKFQELKSEDARSFLKTTNQASLFKMGSYEIKKEISSDGDLKKAYFQAVSNSSWANYGYLVAHEISNSLEEEMERLNQSFGIGIIELTSNPFESKILYPADVRELDYKTIDKLCHINRDFTGFIKKVDNYLSVGSRFAETHRKEFIDDCDDFFTKDAEIEEYCRKHKIDLPEVPMIGLFT